MTHTQKALANAVERAITVGIISSGAFIEPMKIKRGYLFYRHDRSVHEQHGYGFDTSAGLIRWLDYCIMRGGLYAPTKQQSWYRTPSTRKV